MLGNRHSAYRNPIVHPLYINSCSEKSVFKAVCLYMCLSVLANVCDRGKSFFFVEFFIRNSPFVRSFDGSMVKFY